MGDDPGGVVKSGEQVGLVQTPALVRERRSAHALRSPDIAGKRVRRAPNVLLRPFLLPGDQPLAGQSPVHCRGRQRILRRDFSRLRRPPDQLADTHLGGVRLDRQQRFGHIRRHPPRLRAVTAALPQLPLEAPLPVEPEPAVGGPFRKPDTAAVGNLPPSQPAPESLLRRDPAALRNRRRHLVPEQRYCLPVLHYAFLYPSISSIPVAPQTPTGPQAHLRGDVALRVEPSPVGEPHCDPTRRRRRSNPTG